jgi:hypothetical protein
MTRRIFQVGERVLEGPDRGTWGEDVLIDPADRGPLVLGPNASVGVLEKVYEPDDAALRKLLRLLKGVGRG